MDGGGWGIYSSDGWDSYGKVSYCFLGDMLENTDLQVTSDLYLCDQVMGHVH